MLSHLGARAGWGVGGGCSTHLWQGLGERGLFEFGRGAVMVERCRESRRGC